MKKWYNVWCTWSVGAMQLVEAEDEDDAIATAQDAECLPPDAEYIPDSFEAQSTEEVEHFEPEPVNLIRREVE